MKQGQEHKIGGYIWHIIGGITVGISMSLVALQLIDKGMDYFYSKNRHSAKSQDDGEWGIKIVRKSTLGDIKDGKI